MIQKIDYNLVIVDDHLLVADSLKMLIETFSGYHVLYYAKNGMDLQQKISMISLFSLAKKTISK
jgi:YesN/AraC family two-component response regulator